MEHPPVTQSLLVPLDGSSLADHAIPAAVAVAAPAARIVLFRVIASKGGLEGVLDRLGSGGETAHDNEATARAELGRSAKLLDGRAGVEQVTAAGDPAETILTAVASLGVGGVVIASHGRGAVGRWVFGGVADRIARESPVPVLIVRPEDPEAQSAPAVFRRLLLPLDGSETAMQALPVAAGLAHAHGWPLHLLTAVDVASMTPMAVPGSAMPISGELYEQVYDEVEAATRQSLAEATTRLTSEGLTATTELRVGSPYAAIAGAIQAGDLVVLTSHGRAGIQRVLLGSVAEELIRFAPAPVMLVPAAGRQGAGEGAPS